MSSCYSNFTVDCATALEYIDNNKRGEKSTIGTAVVDLSCR
jgi:hypothetical protein